MELKWLDVMLYQRDDGLVTWMGAALSAAGYAQ